MERQLDQERKEYEKTLSDLKQKNADILERSEEKWKLTLDKAVLKIERDKDEEIQKLKTDKQMEVVNSRKNVLSF